MTRAVKAAGATHRLRVSTADLEVRLSALTARACARSTLDEEARQGFLGARCCWGRDKGQVVVMLTFLLGDNGHEVFVSRSEASFGRASRDTVAGHSYAFSAWSVAATNQAGSIKGAATPANRGP